MGKRDLLAGVLDRSGANSVLARATAWNGLLVLNYHRVGRASEAEFDPALYSATEDEFAAQVGYLTRHFDLLGISDLPQALDGRPGRFAMITFDDGYLDNYEAAYPILRAFGAKAVFFLTSGFLDERGLAWWDEICGMARNARRAALRPNRWVREPLPLAEGRHARSAEQLLRVYKTLRPSEIAEFLDTLGRDCGTGRFRPDDLSDVWMTWDQVREMHAAGLEFGGHTVTHPVLANLPREDQLWEVSHCRRRIESEIGRPVTAFSYPVGQRESFDATTQDCLSAAGYEWAFSYYGGFNRPGSANPLDLRRVAVESHVSRAMFRSLSCLPQLFA